MKFPRIKIIILFVIPLVAAGIAGKLILKEYQAAKKRESVLTKLSGINKAGQAELKALKNKLIACEKTAKELNKTLADKEGELAGLSGEKNSCAEKQTGIEVKIADLEKENAGLLLKLDAAARAQAQKALEDAPKETIKLPEKPDNQSEKQITELKKNNEVLDKKIAELKKNSEALSKKNKELEEKAKEFYQKAQDKERLENDNLNLKRAVKSITAERGVLNARIEGLEKNVEQLINEQANSFAGIGNSYMQAGLYDLAMDAYKKALEINPNDAGLHLRLGFLYKQLLDYPGKAVYHFKKYLALSPKAKNRKEIKYLIEMLSQ